MIDDSRAGRRPGRLGPVRRGGHYCLRTIGRLAAAADRPHPPARTHQFTHNGAADGARCAEHDMPGTA